MASMQKPGAISPVARADRAHSSSPASTKVAAHSKRFENLLETVIRKMSQPDSASSSYCVRRGDTLSAICKSELSQGGNKPSSAEVFAAVKRVAAANRLASADKIRVGQTLDLSAARGDFSARGGRTSPWHPRLSDIGDLLKTTRPQPDLVRALNVVESGGRLTSSYGIRLNPFSNQPEHHDGVDIAAAAGTRVVAAKSGEVVFSGWQSGYGKTVIIRHDDGTQTLYAHNQANLVKRGQTVDAKTAIAKVGSTGDSTGPHVHFELRRDGKSVDPATALAPLLEVPETFESLNVLS